MRIYNQPVELIADAPASSAKTMAGSDIRDQLAKSGILVDIIEKKAELPAGDRKNRTKPFPAAAGKEKIYLRSAVKDTEMNPWDLAHQSSNALGSFTYIEPDLFHEFTIDRNIDTTYKRSKKGIAPKSVPDIGYDPDWPPHKNVIWHLGDQYSQLKSAREAVQAQDFTVRIGHLDTGYNKTHKVVADRIRVNPLQRNFVDGEQSLDAHDPYTTGPLRMPGHGTGTLGILAGTKINLATDNGVFHDYLGGAWFADVICCRIAPSVVLIKTSSFAEALQYLTGLCNAGIPVHVVSMSMGGAPSQSWADAVNAAYEAGITLVTAAGNNYNGLPTQHVIYPARFGRVIAACGVTNDFKPYHTTKLGEMQGCYGPVRHMKKAISAFTPNMPWARGNASEISFAGAGTSSATPQVAAAAAIYYKKYHDLLDQLQPWQRVEAIRHALFVSASKKGKPPKDPYALYFGNGIIQASDALAVSVNRSLLKTPEDEIPIFPILSTIFKAKPGAAPGKTLAMYNMELAQLVFNYPALSAIIDHEDKPYKKISSAKWKKFTEAVIAHPATSISLKQFLIASYGASKR